jgi:hypothetical protein
MKNFIIFYVFIATSICCFAQNYWFDSVAGNDNNPTNSEATPWKSMSKINEVVNSLNSGDTIWLKRGSVWYGEILRFEDLTNASTVYIKAYGNTSYPLPIIDARKGITNWSNPGSWTTVSGVQNVYRIALFRTPKRLIMSEIEYVEADRSATDPVALINDTCRWYGGNNNDRYLYVYATQNPALEYSSMSGSVDNISALIIEDSNNIYIQNIEFKGGYDGCVLIKNSENISFNGCTIGAWAHHGILVRPDWGDTDARNKTIIIESCTIDSKANLSYNYEYSNIGDGVFFMRAVTGSYIRNSSITNWGHSSINLYGEENYGGVNNNAIYNNIVSAPNVSYSRGLDINGSLNKASGNLIYQNDFKQLTVRIQFNGNNNHFFYNIVRSITQSPVKSYNTAQGISLAGFGADPNADNYFNAVCKDNRIFNNVFTSCEGAGIELLGAAPQNALKSGHVISNNILFGCGLQNGGVALSVQDNSDNNTFQNNVAYWSYITGLVSYHASSISVGAFNNKNGDRGNIVSNNQRVLPVFENYFNYKLEPSSNPTLIDSGVFIGNSWPALGDFDGTTTPIGTTDIGAQETP